MHHKFTIDMKGLLPKLKIDSIDVKIEALYSPGEASWRPARCRGPGPAAARTPRRGRRTAARLRVLLSAAPPGVSVLVVQSLIDDTAMAALSNTPHCRLWKGRGRGGGRPPPWPPPVCNRSGRWPAPCPQHPCSLQIAIIYFVVNFEPEPLKKTSGSMTLQRRQNIFLLFHDVATINRGLLATNWAWLPPASSWQVWCDKMRSSRAAKL